MVGYGTISWSLTQLLRKDAFGWNEEAFQQLKLAMTIIPVLALPKFSNFVIETDASSYGLRAVLMHNQQPIAYFSQILSARSQQKSIYERELMAIVLAIQKWRQYVLGRKFIVCTDQHSLKYLLEQWVIPGDFQCWVTKLMGYKFEI